MNISEGETNRQVSEHGRPGLCTRGRWANPPIVSDRRITKARGPGGPRSWGSVPLLQVLTQRWVKPDERGWSYDLRALQYGPLGEEARLFFFEHHGGYTSELSWAFRELTGEQCGEEMKWRLLQRGLLMC